MPSNERAERNLRTEQNLREEPPWELNPREARSCGTSAGNPRAELSELVRSRTLADRH